GGGCPIRYAHRSAAAQELKKNASHASIKLARSKKQTPVSSRSADRWLRRMGPRLRGDDVLMCGHFAEESTMVPLSSRASVSEARDPYSAVSRYCLRSMGPRLRGDDVLAAPSAQQKTKASRGCAAAAHSVHHFKGRGDHWHDRGDR